MILSQPEIRVLDVKCHISSAKEQTNFRVSESVRAEVSDSAETPRFESIASQRLGFEMRSSLDVLLMINFA
ncbi:hypothetical protein F2Q68_00043309 [Brassica cretica]|uniref:Uncharacterized protein n=1 Tax=Brassica cretica TaxID=69181 RepID=A0A8S9LP15_BRACR|nr:hypothetical protein F2Q68_00043309 [Brassica cretica]